MKSEAKKVIPETLWNKLLKLKKLKDLKLLYFRLILWLAHDNYIASWPIRILLGPSKEIRKFDSIKHYGLSKPHHIQFLNRESQQLAYSIPDFYSSNASNNALNQITGYERFLLEIRNAQIIGGSNLLLVEDNIAIYETKFRDITGKFSYSDEAILYYNNYNCLIKSISTDMAIHEGIFLGGNYSWNYYHFLFELMVKFKDINHSNIGHEVPLLVDEVCFRIPQYLELLSLLNENGRKLIPLKKDYKYLVNRLYIVSCPNYLPPNYVKIYDAEPSDFLYDLSSLSYLRTALIPSSGNISTPAKLFISRKKASRRRRYNEEEVFQVLQEFGFEKIYPENYSFADQVQLFNNADFIIGGSGAAFSNLIFCRQTCKVICLTNFKCPLSIFSTIASFIGLEFIYMYDTTLPYTQMSDLHNSFTIDVIRLKSMVSQWI